MEAETVCGAELNAAQLDAVVLDANFSNRPFTQKAPQHALAGLFNGLGFMLALLCWFLYNNAVSCFVKRIHFVEIHVFINFSAFAIDHAHVGQILGFGGDAA